MIHPSSIIDPRAELGENVEIGPNCVVDGHVVIGDGCRLIAFVCLRGPLVLGRENTLYPFTCIGFEPQDRKFDGISAGVTIGDRNMIRESVTIHAATQGDRATTIGNDNMLMTSVHVAHDVTIGNRCTLVTGAGLGGHSLVEDDVSIGGHSSTHQFCRMGRLSFLGAQSIITKDLPPFALASGFNNTMGVNLVGLRRGGVAHMAVDAVKAAFSTLYLNGHTTPRAATLIEESATTGGPGAALCQELATFVRQSLRGLVPHVAVANRQKFQR